MPRGFSVATIMTVVALVTVWAALGSLRRPFANAGLASGHDAVTHLHYAYRFDRAMEQGQFPVRWVEAYEPGRGQPLFNFYQVGFYYVVELVHEFIPRFSRAYKLTTVYIWWAAALFMFLAQRRQGTLPAALGALVFAISPYLIFDTLERAAFPEFTAIAAGAGVLWGLDSLLTTGRPVYVPMTAVCIGALLVSHLPTAVMLSVMFAIHVLSLLLAGDTQPRRLLWLAPAFLLGAALAAFYVLPALGELDLIQIWRLTEGAFDFHNNFMTADQWIDFRWKYGASANSPDDLMPLQVGIIQWMAILLAAFFVVADVTRRRKVARTMALASGLAIAGIAMFMCVRISLPVWEHVPILAFIQYPWRFMMLLPFAGGLLSARLLALVPDRGLQAMTLPVVAVFLLLLYTPAMQPQFYRGPELIDADNPAWPTFVEARSEYIEPGYYPAGVTTVLKPTPSRWSIEGEGDLQEISETDTHRRIEVRTNNGLVATMHTPYFPGWTMRMDGAAVAPHVRPGDAYMAIAVPPGTHRIEATFGNTPMRKWANIITGLSAAGVLLFFVGAASLDVLRLARYRT